MLRIEPFSSDKRDDLISLALRAWEPVFPLTEQAVSPFVYRAFYPDGWRARQRADISTVLDEEPENIDVAISGSQVAGWVCTRLHPEDRMGEVCVLAVDPDLQRRGIGRALLDHSTRRAKSAGMSMVMVETGDDPGHEPARRAYEADGFERWPVARYFKNLSGH